eukprot:CAMPEP_0117438356 /NCGR_PEP_ID=MMETSP0759-20121206/2011_1 /TAXON_ID=63605 /ORGANISM="Percolomonas cosmopolitus, Strain WS" /LENGTH=135 /DNA_ID=CAMNT_0005230045 /DNA_START=964 /DNA_END=1371 /DNA_ORIENTATION=-
MNIGNAYRGGTKYPNGGDSSTTMFERSSFQYPTSHHDAQTLHSGAAPSNNSLPHENPSMQGYQSSPDHHFAHPAPHQHTEEYILANLKREQHQQHSTNTTTASQDPPSAAHTTPISTSTKHPLRHGGEKEISVQQ